MSDKPEDKGPDPDPVDDPPTRKIDVVTEAPVRESHLSLEMAPAAFPDDGAVSQQVRRVDHYLGLFEQALVFALLSLVVLVAAAAAISDKAFHSPLGRWWHYIVRGGTFAVAMFAAVFTTQQQRHLAMDLISRRLTPRGRLVLRVLLAMAVTVLVALLVRSGQHLRERELAAVAEQGGSCSGSTSTTPTSSRRSRSAPR